jgi:hypothetical protein
MSGELVRSAPEAAAPASGAPLFGTINPGPEAISRQTFDLLPLPW